MQLAATSVSAMAAATSPEDAAKVFLAEASKGLALVIADAISKSVQSTAATASTGAIAGWENLIGGLVANLEWQSPSILSAAPLVQLNCFAPYQGTANGNIHTLGGSVSIGITVGATF